MFKLPHDGGLGQEVRPGLVRGPRLEGLDGHEHVVPVGDAETPPAYVPEFATPDYGLDGDEFGVDLFRKVFHSQVWILVGVRIHIGFVRTEGVVNGRGT